MKERWQKVGIARRMLHIKNLSLFKVVPYLLWVSYEGKTGEERNLKINLSTTK